MASTTSINMSGKALEDIIKDKILAELRNTLDDMEGRIKQMNSLQLTTDSKMNDLRVDTDAKINGLKNVNNAKRVPWKCIGSGSTAPTPPAEDDPSIFELSHDLYTILATASFSSFPFWMSMLLIVGLQYFLLFLLLANQVDLNSDDNPLNLPANVESPVRISQVLLAAIALFSQDDLLVGIELLVDGTPALFRGNDRFANMTRFRWGVSSILRLLQGLLNLLAAFVLSIQSETVPDVLLNVLGVGFISNLDDLAFGLSLKGYFGSSMKALSRDLCDVDFYRHSKQSPSAKILAKIKGAAHIVLAFAVLQAMIAAFVVLAVQQNEGTYSEQDIQVEFGDEILPFLGLFNGCYKASHSSNYGSGRLIYEQVGFPNGGKFGFCSDFGEGEVGWAFFIGDAQDICDKYIARSDETATFSLLEAARTKWYTSDDLPLDYLEITEIKTATDECGQSMYTASIDACPSILAFDSMSMSRVPANIDVSSRSFLDTSISHPIYYSDATEVGSFTLIFFAGRRWIRTKSDYIPELGNETSLADIHDFFFVHDGLFSFIDNLKKSSSIADEGVQRVDSISEAVDVTTDQGSPLGLQWYFTRYEENTENTDEDKSWRELQLAFPSADLARPMDSVLTCLYCNDRTNPCLHDGKCDNDSGVCDCTHGTEGRLCQVKPLGNGVCNPYFNTKDYNYDGGDCCAGTCVGPRCGEDDLVDPFPDAEGPFSSNYGGSFFGFEDMTEEWKDTFRGREFAFGIDVISDGLSFEFPPPRRFGHCVDPQMALLTIEVTAKPHNIYDDTGTVSAGGVFQAITVRCDGKVFLQTPGFWTRGLLGPTFAERIRVPHGSNCDMRFEEEVIYQSSFTDVAIFAENQSVPLVKQTRGEYYRAEHPMGFHILESSCVWNVLVDNLISVGTVIGDLAVEWPDAFEISLEWNEYLSEDDFTNFAEGAQLDSICKRDPEEVLDRFALWKIAKSAPLDLSPNFVGHVCESPWLEGYLTIDCRDFRAIEFAAGGRITDAEISEILKYSVYFKKLERHDISGANLDKVPSEIGLLSTLPILASLVLSSSSNEPQLFPSEIGSLTLLAELYLESNALTSLPPEFASLTSLTKLYLSDNRFPSLPSEIGNLSSLAELELRRNYLTSLPSEIANLTSLQRLDLLSNGVTSLQFEIGSLTSLTLLDMEGNRLVSLPPEIGRLTLLTRLNLESNDLTSLPPEIGRLTLLTQLSLQSNDLKSLPSEIGRLASLAWMDFKNNRLPLLPSEIGNLTSLTRLQLHSNYLKSLPSEIGSLTLLTYLDTHANRLRSIPSEIGSLTLLTKLDLESLQLESVPSEIGRLTSLTLLDLFFNRISSLPSDIGRLTALTKLDLRWNPLKVDSLPAEMEILQSLNYMYICDGNGGDGCLEADSNDGSTNNDDNANCTSIVGWADIDGYGCDWYAAYDKCGKWSFVNPAGISDTEACCFCGGGTTGNDGGGDGDTINGGNSNCTDSIGWLDSAGDGCDWYEANDACGGARVYADSNSVSAKLACCYCGGGSTRDYGNCTNSVGWVDSQGYDCTVYESELRFCSTSDRFKNADGISAAEACCFCLDGASTGEDDAISDGGSTGVVDDEGNSANNGDKDNCTNSIGWVDKDGDGCEWYETNDRCDDVEIFQNAEGISATDACCYCGGGAINEDE